jgi:ATP-dependent Clp protease ATP-binding subunit ClpC
VDVPQDRPGPNPGPFDDLFERLIGNLESTLGDAMGAAGNRRPASDHRTPRLDRFGRDLTAEAVRGGLDPVIGRDSEIDQVLEVLARRTKNNPVLVGDPGVGKTAIAEGVAQRVAHGAVPESLRGVRVVALDLAGMVAGTRYRGDFEQRLTGVIDEVVAAERSIVLFLDELHTVIGAGSAEGAPMDAASMLKPALARGDLRLIGATTVQEYRRRIEKDAALERRFEPVPIAEPTVEATIAILRGLRSRYEEHHGVRISDTALVAAAELSDRYVPDRFLPDKAIDLLDRASSRARFRSGEPAPGPADRAGAEELEQLRRAREVAVDAEDFERAHLLTREI